MTDSNLILKTVSLKYQLGGSRIQMPVEIRAINHVNNKIIGLADIETIPTLFYDRKRKRNLPKSIFIILNTREGTLQTNQIKDRFTFILP